MAHIFSLSLSLFLVDRSLRLAFKYVRCKITLDGAALPVTLILRFE